jgi:hypothetical protein
MDVEGSGRGLIEGDHCPGIGLESLREIRKNVKRGSRCSRRDSNGLSSEYRSEAIPLDLTPYRLGVESVVK